METEADKDGATAGSGEAEAWADVERAWSEDERHRAYLARFADLDGLAVAGRRYRAALDARPGDPTALRFRDEILRRATAMGLPSAPHVEPTRTRSALVVRAAAIVLALALAAVAAVGALRLLQSTGGRP